MDYGESRSLITYLVETDIQETWTFCGKNSKRWLRSTPFLIEREAHSSRGLLESQYANNSTNGLTAMLSGKEFPIPSPWWQLIKKKNLSLKIAFIWQMKNNKQGFWGLDFILILTAKPSSPWAPPSSELGPSTAVATCGPQDALEPMSLKEE